jgi:hypothetical protein
MEPQTNKIWSGQLAKTSSQQTQPDLVFFIQHLPDKLFKIEHKKDLTWL